MNWLHGLAAAFVLIAALSSLSVLVRDGKNEASSVAQSNTYGNNINIRELNITVSQERARKERQRVLAERRRESERSPSPESEKALAIAKEQSADTLQQTAIETAKWTITSLAAIQVGGESLQVFSNRQLANKLHEAAHNATIGDFGAAREVFDEVRAVALASGASERELGAEASFGLARLSNYELDFRAALRFSKEAVDWAPKNPRYVAYRAQLLAFLDKGEEARECVSRAQELLESAGPLERMESLTWLGDAFHDLNQPEESVRSYLGALKEYGSGKFDTEPNMEAEILISLAAMYSAMLKLDEAAPLYLTALGIYKRTKAPTIKLIYLQNNIGLFYLNTGCVAVAYRFADAALGQRESILDGADPVIGFALGIRGRSRFLTGDTAGALADLHEATTQIASAFGTQHWRYAQFNYYLAEILLALGRLGEAQIANERARNLFERLHDPPAYWYASTLVQFARLEVAMAPRADISAVLSKAEQLGRQTAPSLERALRAKIDLANAEVAAARGSVGDAIASANSAIEEDLSSWNRLIVEQGNVAPALKGLVEKRRADIQSLVDAQASPLCVSAPLP